MADVIRRALVLLALSMGCSRAVAQEDVPPAPSLVSFKVAGSSAILPFMTRAANAYMRSHPGVAIQVEAGASSTGLAQVAAGTVAIGTSDRFAVGDRAALLEDHQIAVAGLAAMANRGAFNASVHSLTREQLKRIFTGQVRDWLEVGGSSQPISVIHRPPGSGTRDAFGAYVLGGAQFMPGVVEESSAQVQTALLQTPGAISYLAISYRHPDLVVFAVNGVAASAENIAKGTYPIWSYEHLYTRGPATGEVRAFIDFVLSPPMQGETLDHLGFIPIGAMTVSRQND